MKGQRKRTVYNKLNINVPVVIDPEKLHDENKSPGQPCKYLQDPEFYKEFVKYHMGHGMTKEAAAVQMAICPMTLRNWTKRGEDALFVDKADRSRNEQLYVEFFYAIKKGEMFRQMWWEETGRRNVNNPMFNATLWMMNMQNLFRKHNDLMRGDGWVRSTTEEKKSIKVSGTLNHKHKFNPKKLEREDAEKLRDIIAAATTESTDDR